MKKGTITLKQLQKLYKAVAHTPAPTKLYEVGGTLRADYPKSFTYLKLNGGKYTQKDKELISFLKKN